MGNAKYIGRVGALAVSLGVGVAMVTWPAAALAETSDAGAASSSAAPSSDNSTSADSEQSPQDTPSGNPDPSEEESSETPSPEDPSSEDPSVDEISAEDSDDTQDGDDEGGPEPDPSPPPDPEATDPVADQPESGHSQNVASAKPDPDEVSAFVADAPSLDSPKATRLDNVRLAAQTPALQTTTAQLQTATTTSSALKTNTVAVQSILTAPAAPVTAVSTVASVVSAFLGWAGLGPSLNATPVVPVEPPILWAVLAWVRRQFQQTFFNQTPTAAPVQPTTPTAGLVTGALNAFDAEGDPLQFTVTRPPTNGTVAISADGTYVYTPNAGSPEDDSFEVKVTDVGNHLHLSNFFAPDFGASYVVTVPVDVAEAVVGTRIPVGDQPSTVEVRSDGTRAYVLHGPSSRVSVIDTATDTVVATIPVGVAGWTSRGLALRPDGTQAYVTTQRPDGIGFLAVIDTATNTVTKTILVGNNTLNGVAVDANGVVYVVAFGSIANPGVVAAVDVVTDMITPLAAVGRAPQFVAVRPGGSQLYVTNFDDDTVTVVSGTAVVATISVGDGADGIAFSSNGTRAYVTNFNAGTVSVIDATSNAVIKTIVVGASPVGVTVSPDGTAVYVATFGTGNVTVIDTTSLTVVEDIPVADGPADVAFRPDGQRAYVTRNVDDSVSVITFD